MSATTATSASAAAPAGSAAGSNEMTAAAGAAVPGMPTTTADTLLPPSSSTGALGDDADAAALSTQSYLEKTVMGVLALALEDVCRVRPTNPVDYLGSYLLRRSSANNTVEVTYEDTLPKPVHADGEEA